MYSGTVGSISNAITSTINTGANYTFNGSAPQSTHFKTGSSPLNNLTIANTGGVNTTSGGVTLTEAMTIGTAATGVLTLTSGVFITTSLNTPVVANTSSIPLLPAVQQLLLFRGLLPGIYQPALTGYLPVTFFPVGVSVAGLGTYLPFGLTSVTTGATAPPLTVTAFGSGFGW